MYQETCPYCNIHADEEQNVVFENETCYFIQKESEQQILQGSGLIIPKQHKQNVFELSDQEWMDSRELLAAAKNLLDTKYSPDGYSVGWNTGRAGGQSIFHAHLHVIPRFKDEPLAGRGIRYWIKQEENRRN
ncbi:MULTISPECIES: HIT family protein [Bacillaceae]|jgi:diadenosine tetraphosphate (Ap4A) HIT family hydrolase|uniref:HIT family protein n=1 Tax=Bacillaceae TaxID=186817 RepID=UPI0011A71DC3|nr:MULTISPECIES: HIT family protein [Bacillaceae]MCM3125086.1 HIT family protein [Mesobacillus sp. MER 33]MCM3235154.1 HIT family protein [Mesobacillus sp. MER 48]